LIQIRDLFFVKRTAFKTGHEKRKDVTTTFLQQYEITMLRKEISFGYLIKK